MTTLQDGGIGSLRWALDTAPSGSTITFDQHIWNQEIILTADLVITKKHLNIRGPDTGRITINNKMYLVHVGIGAFISISSLTFTNDKSNGLCILLNDGELSLTKSTISGNAVSGGCGGTAYPGGSIRNGGELELINSTVSNNTASSGSGGIANDGGKLLLSHSIISNNTGSGGFGGGIENYQGTLQLTDSTISENTNAEGGGIDNFDGNATLTESTILNNTASSGSGGGGIINEAQRSKLMIKNSIVNGNRAMGIGGKGGGILNIGPEVTLVNSTVSDNSASDDGGGIESDRGQLTLTNSTVANNKASNGGGIKNYGAATLINSTVSDNTASGIGGGISNDGQMELAFCTLYGNTATKGGGLFARGGFGPPQYVGLITRNSLIAGNRSPIASDVAGNIISGGYNLIQNKSGIAMQRTDLSGNPTVDPKLQQNKGLTQTHALLPDSAAINAVPLESCHITLNGITIDTDQRGIKRPRGAVCDIGAYEYAP